MPSENPVDVLLSILLDVGWEEDEIDLASFEDARRILEEEIDCE